jgi:hypothetical protein
MPFSEAQQWALVIAPKVTGFISIVFSALVIFTVARCKEKRSKTYHRLLFGISCVDVSSSFWLGLSTWPIPEETGIKWASGTTATCVVQGFFTQFGVTSSFYNASLSVFYLLGIKYGWREHHIYKIEPFLHGIPLLWGLVTAIAGIPLTIFNSANLWCWIAPYKDRGADADLFRWVFFYGPLWIMIFIVTMNVVLIFMHVRKIEKVTEKYQMDCNETSKNQWNQPHGAEEVQVLEDDGLPEEEAWREDETENMHVKSKCQEAVEEMAEEEAVKSTKRTVPEKKPLEEETDAVSVSGSVKSRTLPSNSMSGGRFRFSRRYSSSFRVDDKKLSSKKRSRHVARQSLRYAGSFYFTWIALTVRAQSSRC